MCKFKVYTELFDEVEEYVGCWYTTQINPQHVYLCIHNSGKVEINYDCAGGGVTGDVFCNRLLMLRLPDTVYYIDHCKNIIAQLEPEIKALLEGYEEEWDGQNYRGSWNLDLAIDLEKKLERYRSTIRWNYEGVIEQSIKDYGN